MLRHDRIQKKGGGLCSFINKKYHIKDHSTLNIMNKHIELQCFEVKSDVRRPVVVINIYRPPSGTITAAFEHIREVLDNDLFNRSKCLMENFEEFKFVQKTWALSHNYVGQYV